MKFMLIILGIIIPHISCNEALFDALDKALRNDSNLYELHRLLYPGSYQASSTVLLSVASFTVGNNIIWIYTSMVHQVLLDAT